MDVFTTICTIVVPLVDPVKRQLGYLIYRKKYETDMGIKKKDLDDKKVNVEEKKNDKERNIFVVPKEVDGWLKKVANIDKEAASISGDAGSCFNIKRRYKRGRKAFKIIEEINALIVEYGNINWPDQRIPPGKVDSKKASASTKSSHHNDFPSRERTFNEALEQLHSDHKSRMIALCGMGGVGKTTLMEKLQKVAEEKTLFNMIVKVVIGEKINPIVIQQSVADFLGIDLKESDKGARAIMLQKSFEATSNQGKKILVILDDVWVPFELKDIGLSPLPNQGVGFKVLLTSRIQDVCINMGVKVDSILNVDTIIEQEAQSFFHQCVKTSDGDDLDLNLRKIGDDIANRCHGLPMAIKTIASFLKCYRSDKHVWEERFKISLGCYLKESYGQNKHSYENTLMLVTDKCEIVDFRMNELFEKTEVLHLQVKDVNDLVDGLVKSLHHQQSSYYNLRVLKICKCENLRYLFTVSVANGLTKLEHLTISSCPVLETLVGGERGEVGVIKLQVLKFLSLDNLPKLMSLCSVVNVIELPQLEELILDSLPNFTSIYPEPTSSMSNDISTMHPFLKKEVVIPKLKKLKIYRMERLKKIWPINPIPLLHHLEELEVNNCGLVEVLFNIDLGCIIEKTSCCLRRIKVQDLRNLREVWRIKGGNNSGLLISGFEAVESLEIWNCERFRNVFTPTTTNFDMRALTNLRINCYKGRQEQEVNEETLEVGDTISNVLFSSNIIHTFHHVRTVQITSLKRAKVVFEIESSSSTRELATPYLEDLKLSNMECMSHVWKCNWNKFLIIPQNQQSSFHNLTTIYLWHCKNIKYLFSPLMAKLLYNLRNVTLRNCVGIEEVVSSQDDEDEELVASTSTNTNANWFPHLDTLRLIWLPNFKRIGGGSTKISSTTPIHHQSNKLPQVNDVAWSLCQYSRKINIWSCEALPHVIPSYALAQMQKLENLKVDCCKSLVEVFETQGFNINGCNNIDEGSGGNDITMVIQRMKKINVPQLSNLKELIIDNCALLQHVFTFSTLESLMRLEVLSIRNCEGMKVVVKEDNGGQTTVSSEVVVFPHLKTIKLENLPNLTGFFFGKNEFEWSLLDYVMIVDCPQMTVFTSGYSVTRKLNYIHTELGKHSLEQYGLNFPVMAATLHESPSSSLDTTSLIPTTSKRRPWSFHSLIEINLGSKDDLKKIIPSNEFRQLQKLEKIHVKSCDLVEEVFEALEGIDGSELQSVVVEISQLREVELGNLCSLKYIWKNNPWMVLKFPNLTKLSIIRCDSLKHVFSRCMVGSLLQLQDLDIIDCRGMKVIVKEEGEGEWEDKVNEIIMLPRLKSLTLKKLPSLKGFYLGNEAFSWSSLDTMDIEECPAITVFTMGHLTTPELKVIDTSFGRCELAREQDLNSFINTKQQEGLQF